MDKMKRPAFYCVVVIWIMVSGFSHVQTPELPDAAGLLQTAKSQFDGGAFSSAAAVLAGVLAKHPENALAHFWLARCYNELHDYDRAVTHAELSVSLDPTNSLYHQWLAHSYGMKAERDRNFFLARKVRKELEKAVLLDPKNVAARRDLQEFFMDAPWLVGGSKEKARDTANAIAAIDALEGHLAHASLYYKGLKRPDLAEREYLLVLASSPKTIGPYVEISEFFEDRKNGPELLKTVAGAEKIDASDPRIAYYHGAALIILGTDLKRAEKLLRDYLATPEKSDWPSHAAAHEWLGRLHGRQGKSPAGNSHSSGFKPAGNTPYADHGQNEDDEAIHHS